MPQAVPSFCNWASGEAANQGWSAQMQIPKAWICRFNALVGSPFLREILELKTTWDPLGSVGTLYVIYMSLVSWTPPSPPFWWSKRILQWPEPPQGCNKSLVYIIWYFIISAVLSLGRVLDNFRCSWPHGWFTSFSIHFKVHLSDCPFMLFYPTDPRNAAGSCARDLCFFFPPRHIRFDGNLLISHPELRCLLRSAFGQC